LAERIWRVQKADSTGSSPAVRTCRQSLDLNSTDFLNWCGWLIAPLQAEICRQEGFERLEHE